MLYSIAVANKGGTKQRGFKMTMTMTLNLKADREAIGEQLLKYGYSVATRKGFKGASLDDAATAFATGAWIAYTNLDADKANGGDGLGYIWRGGMNGLISASRTMKQNSQYGQKNKAEDLYSDMTARPRTLRGEYSPADLGDEGEGASLFDMIGDARAVNPAEAVTKTDTIDHARAFLATLTAQEQRIMLATAEGKTTRAIGEAEGLSHAMVAKIQNRVRESARFAA